MNPELVRLLLPAVAGVLLGLFFAFRGFFRASSYTVRIHKTAMADHQVRLSMCQLAVANGLHSAFSCLH